MRRVSPSQNRKAPSEKGSKEATFIALAASFRFSDEVANLFLKGPMESLEDFRYYFADEKEIYAYVAAALGPEATTSLEPEEEPVATLNQNDAHHRRRIQISRVRHAWKATRQIGLHRDNRIGEISMKSTDRIQKETLRRVKLQFWELRCTPPHRLLYMESQDFAPSSHDHQEEEAGRHRSLHIR